MSAARNLHRLLHRGLYLIFCALAGVFCVELWADHTIIYNLVHIAIVGIDYDQPLQLSSIDPRYYQSRTNLLFWWSISSSIVVVINWLILVRLARQWSMGFKRRLTWIVLLVVGVLASSAFLIWLYAGGLKEISPSLAEYSQSSAYSLLAIGGLADHRCCHNRRLTVWQLIAAGWLTRR